jgi:predicted nucleotidyltransferase
MKLKHFRESVLRAEILKIIEKYLDSGNYKVFFFGSRINGTGDEHSDIDLGIEGSESIPISTFAKIKEDLDAIAILYKIDVVDFHNTPEEFRQIAKNKIEYLN